MAIWPAATAATLDLLSAINNTKVTLTVDAAVGDTTLTVDDASQLPASGYLTFDDNATNPETIFYTGRTTNNLTGVTRGADGTAASSHASAGSTTHIEQRWNAAYHTIHSTEIIAIETDLATRFGHDAGSHQILSADGTVLLPQFSFSSDPNTGVYRIGADDVAIATNGTKALEVNATQQVVIPKTSNQLIIGTTNTVTISSTAPSGSRTYTIPDAGGAASFVMTAGTQVIAGSTTFSVAVTVSATTNQIVLGTTNTVTIHSPAPASSRVYTIPDAGGAASFVMTAGTQTLTGATTFSAVLTVSAGIKGTATNDNATAGNVGEYVTSYVGALNAPTSSQWGDQTSIALTAGDWDVSIICGIVIAGVTTRALIGVGKTAGNNGPDIVNQYPDDFTDIECQLVGTASTPTPGTIPTVRVSLSGSATVYLKVEAIYTGGPPQFRGRISARRVR